MVDVLLGFVDQPISDTSTLSWDTNKIGGLPIWVSEPSRGPPYCSVCSLPKTFVSQFYCPLNGSEFHRTLYVFVCPQCHRLNQKGSWTVLRSQCVVGASSLKHAETGASQNTDNSHTSSIDEWCSDADDWDVDTDDNRSNGKLASDRQESVHGSICSTEFISPETNIGHDVTSLPVPSQDSASVPCAAVNDISSDEPAQLLQHLTINNDHKKPVSMHDMASTNSEQHAVSDMQGELSSRSSESACNVSTEIESYYVYVLDEPSSADDSDHVQDLLSRYTRQEGGNFKAELETGNCSSGGGEKYEKVSVHHGDYTFYKFTQKISNCPNQIVRYCRNGQPLFAGSDTCNIVIPRCKCGSSRTFELQLMPALVCVLRRPQQSEPLVEFMTVHIYTCSQNCWPQDAETVEEFAIVEYDRDSRLVDEALSRISAGTINNNTVLEDPSAQSAS